MQSILSLLLDGSGIPHGYCIAWDSRLIWVMVTSNAMIALAYFSIPFALARFLRLQRGLPFGWMFVLFSAFIFSCGLTHLLEIVNIYRPAYRLDAVLMAITAVISLATAAALFPLVPTASAYITRNQQRDSAVRALNEELQGATALLAQRNAALEASEQRFRLTLQGAPIGLAIVSLQGRFLEVNDALCEILEYTAPELLALTFQQITHPDDLGQDEALLANLLAGKSQSYRMEKRYFARSGRVLAAQLDVTLLRGQDGTPLHFISQIQDITERRLLEETLRNSEAHARALVELNGTLQACHELQEVGPPTSKACVAAYPGSSGVIYIRNASKTALERIHSWGEPAISAAVFAPDGCWALRRGEPFAASFGDDHVHICQHIQHQHGMQHSLCVPMLAQGEVVGVLHLQWPLASSRREPGSAEQIATRTALAVANLQLREKLTRQSIVDPLTGLYNRRHLEESLNRDVARAEREGTQVAVLMIDVDHFKRYNDQYGHALGDSVLQKMGAVLAGFCRRGDLAARYGGEEFTVVMSDIDEATAHTRAELLRERMGLTRLGNSDTEVPPITISVGLALYPVHGDTPLTVIEAADQALYAAKRAGRNRVVSRSEMTTANSPDASPEAPPRDGEGGLP